MASNYLRQRQRDRRSHHVSEDSPSENSSEDSDNCIGLLSDIEKNGLYRIGIFKIKSILRGKTVMVATANSLYECKIDIDGKCHWYEK